MKKFYIWGEPNQAPDLLLGDTEGVDVDYPEHKLIHEFEVVDAAERVDEVADAHGYFRGYVARWEEIHESTSLFKHYIWARTGAPPDLMTDTPEQDDKRYALVHQFEVQHWEFAAVYFKAYVARWEEAPDVFGDVHAFHQVTDLPHPADLTSDPCADPLALRERLILEKVNDKLLPALIQLRHLQVDGSPPKDFDLFDGFEDGRKELRDEQMVSIADGIIDAIYVLAGCGVTLGMPLGKVWDEVQRSNMAKADSKTGRDDDKLWWTPPNVAKALGL